MSVRNSRPAPFAARRTSVEARHLCTGRRLVDEYKPFRIKLGLTLEPFFSRRIHRTASLLCGMCGLFFKRVAILRA
jgi:hypothetical protein